MGKRSRHSRKFYFIGLDTINWALAIAHAELVLGTTYASLTMMIPRYHKKEYLHHFTTSTKPTIVYAYNEMHGNEVIDHWNTWTAIEGTEHKSILCVSDTKATRRNSKIRVYSTYLTPKRPAAIPRAVKTNEKPLWNCQSH